MNPSLEIIEASIVLIGRLNPALITPGWLAYHGLIDTADAEQAELLISHPDVSQFSLEWVKIHADKNRLQVSTTQSPHIRISDFFTKLLTELLPSTPIWAVGINLSQHFRVDPEQQNKFGERVAPRQFWGDWGALTVNKEKEKLSGLTTVTLRQGSNLDDREDGYIDVKIETSQIVKGGGLHIYINDHYSLGSEGSIHDSEAAIQLLRKSFEPSLQRSEYISSGIIEQVKA